MRLVSLLALSSWLFVLASGCAAEDVADVVDVVSHRFKSDQISRSATFFPAWIEHPGIQHGTDHPAPFDD